MYYALSDTCKDATFSSVEPSFESAVKRMLLSVYIHLQLVIELCTI